MTQESSPAQGPSPIVGRRSRRRWRVVLLVSSIALSLFAAELLVRRTGRFRPPPYPITCFRPELYQQWQPYGYRLWPSRSTYYVYPKSHPRRLKVESNAHGFRSRREFNEVDERTRVLVVGDSFVFGDGVQQDERFSNLMEAMNPEWRVDNLGMTAYGADLMLMAFEEVGLTAEPDAVLVCIYTDDFHRVQPHYAGGGFENPRYRLVDGQLQITPYPKRQLWDWMHLTQLLRTVQWEYSDAEYRLNNAILRRFVELARQCQFHLGLVFLPGRGDSDMCKIRRTWLREFAERNETQFIDLTEAIHEASDDAFIPGNWHYNPTGHEIVAEQLVPFTHRVLTDFQ